MAISINELLRDRRLLQDVQPMGTAVPHRAIASQQLPGVCAPVEHMTLQGGRFQTHNRHALPAIGRTQSLPSAMPYWHGPAHATLSDDYAADPDWLYERTLDGQRCLVFRNRRAGRNDKRDKKRLADTYPQLVETLDRVVLDPFVADGETIFFKRGFAGFADDPQEIGSRNSITRETLGVCVYLASSPGADLAAAGRADASSSKWLKFTCSEGSVLRIGGYSERGGPSNRGAFLLGSYSNGQFRYAGKVGTGFDEASLSELGRRLRLLEQPDSPFADFDDLLNNGTRWMRPTLVARAGFAEWTRNALFQRGRGKEMRVYPSGIHRQGSPA